MRASHLRLEGNLFAMAKTLILLSIFSVAIVGTVDAIVFQFTHSISLRSAVGGFLIVMYLLLVQVSTSEDARILTGYSAWPPRDGVVARVISRPQTAVVMCLIGLGIWTKAPGMLIGSMIVIPLGILATWLKQRKGE